MFCQCFLGHFELCLTGETACRTMIANETSALRWRHNERDGVSNHQPYDCLPNRLFRRRSKETWKLRVTGLCVRNSPVTGEFPAQRASNAENLSIWWRHNGETVTSTLKPVLCLLMAWYHHLLDMSVNVTVSNLVLTFLCESCRITMTSQ